MNVLNFEVKNSMGTKRTNFSSQSAKQSDLVKSASTSTCCAIENPSQIFTKLQHMKFFNKKNNDDPDENYKQFIVEPLSCLEQNVSPAFEENILKKNRQSYKLRYNNLKYFSDCDLEKFHQSHEPFIILPKSSNTSNNNIEILTEEFNTRRGLDDILMNKHDCNNSIVNFITENEKIIENTFPRTEYNMLTNGAINKELNHLNDMQSRPTNNYFNLNFQLANESSESNLVNNKSDVKINNSNKLDTESWNNRLNCFKTNETREKISKNEKDTQSNKNSSSEKENIDSQETERFEAEIDSQYKIFKDNTQSRPCENFNNLEYLDIIDDTKQQNDVLESQNQCEGNLIKITDRPIEYLNCNIQNEIKVGLSDKHLAEDNQLVKLCEKLEKESEQKDEKIFCRSSSLKIRNESYSNPTKKKIVRFADALGLDLTDVRTFLDELPSEPKSSYKDLKEDSNVTAESLEKFYSSTISGESKSLVPMFQQPSTLLNFLDIIRDNFLCLESAQFSESPVWSITGTVRVRNLDFYKSVYIRYSLDNWCNFSEIQASYVQDSCDGFSDKFTFVIYIYNLDIGQKMEFSVRYHCCGSIYWDNNNGSNYVFECSSNMPTVLSYDQCISFTKDIYNSFY